VAILWTYVRETLGSNLGWDTGYPVFVYFLSAFGKNSLNALPSGHYRYVPNPSQLIIAFPFDASVEQHAKGK
jgi:hypothetical protein